MENRIYDETVFGMQSKATITSQCLHYLPKKKSRLEFGGERVPVALKLRTDRDGRRGNVIYGISKSTSSLYISIC